MALHIGEFRSAGTEVNNEQAANRYPGAARTDPLRAGDVAVPAAPAQPAGRGTRRSRSQRGGGLSAAEQRAVGVGDQLDRHHLLHVHEPLQPVRADPDLRAVKLDHVSDLDRRPVLRRRAELLD